MRGILNHTTVGLLLLVSAGWAEDPSAASDLLSDDIDVYVERRLAIAQDARIQEDSDLHAMLWGDDPDWLIITGGVWWGKLDGPIKFDGDTVLDVSKAFGLNDRVGIPFARAGFRLWRFELIAEGFWYNSDGRAIVDEEFEIDGVVFEVGDVIDSEITLNSYRFALGYELWQADMITVTLIGGVSLINTAGSVKTTATEKRARWNEWIPVPAIGLSIAGVFFDHWIYELEGNWVGFSTDVFALTSVDVRVAVGYQFNDWVLIRLGYRFMSLDGEIDAIRVQLDLSGPYIEGAITF